MKICFYRRRILSLGEDRNVRSATHFMLIEKRQENFFHRKYGLNVQTHAS